MPINVVLINDVADLYNYKPNQMDMELLESCALKQVSDILMKPIPTKFNLTRSIRQFLLVLVIQDHFFFSFFLSFYSNLQPINRELHSIEW